MSSAEAPIDDVMLAENVALQTEEMEALQAIYPDSFRMSPSILSSNEIGDLSSYSITVDDKTGFELDISYVPTYPSASAPRYNVRGLGLTPVDRQKLHDKLIAIYNEKQGEVVVFSWVEWMKDELTSRSPDSPRNITHDSSIREDASSEESEPNDTGSLQPSQIPEKLTLAPHIVHGEPFTEKKSTFQAHVAEVHSVAEVKAVMAMLLQDRKIARATHNIMAYRIYDEERSLIIKDNDEDGESAAGSRLSHVMEIMDVRNVVVVVSRWFGGTLLGPDRFKLINNAARTLLDQAGFFPQSSEQTADKSRSRHKRTVKNSKR